MFFKDNCRKTATKIFGRTINMGELDKIEIIKGHNTSSYFWIMPVKIIDYNKPTNEIENVDEYRAEEISIEEEIISDFLFEYLDKNFDPELNENKKRNEMICGNIFEWNLEWNYYRIETIETIIKEIKEDIEKIRNKDFNENERIENMGSYLYFYLDKQDTKDKSLIFWKYKEIVIEFYQRFIKHMENMIEEAQKNGYELISFMGP